MSSPSRVNEQSYELSMNSMIAFNIFFIAVVMILFPIFRRLAPCCCAPQQHLERKNTGLVGYIVWFIDVFRQPLSVYSTRGNLATMFAVFNVMLLLLYGFLALISLTILVPTYYYGTDQSWSTNYLTFWSKITIAHLEKNSVMNLIPIFVVFYFTVAIMIFYQQFTLVYVFYKQRCLRRQIPQNFVVLVQNLPKDIDLRGEIDQVIYPLRRGVKAVVPVPYESNKLNELHNAIAGFESKQDKIKQNIQDWACNLVYQEQLMVELSIQAQNAAKPGKKLLKKRTETQEEIDKFKHLLEQEMDNFGKTVKQIREIKFKILEVIHKDCIETGYLFQKSSRYISPETAVCFDFLPAKKDTTLRASQFTVSDPVQQASVRMRNQFHLENIAEAQKQSKRPDPQPRIGSAFFLICEDQITAGEKQNSLLSSNQLVPQATIAPNQHEVVWKYMAQGMCSKVTGLIFFWIFLLGLFALYFIGQTLLMGLLVKKQTNWKHDWFEFFAFGNCVVGVEQTGFCVIVQSFVDMLVSIVPTFCFCMMMNFLPLFLQGIIKFLKKPSKAQNEDLLYTILFVFLLLIMGIVQVVFPTMVNVQTGVMDFSILKNIGLSQILENTGRGVISTQQTFLYYAINKYLTWPTFTVMNLYSLTLFIIAKFKSNKLEYNRLLRTTTMNWPKELAYTSHLFVCCLIFAIAAPATNAFCFVTYLMFAAVDRYFILYVNVPTITSDMSAQGNIILKTISAIFLGLCFMLFGTACYFLVQGEQIYIFGVVICAICFIGALVYKLSVDKQYKRALHEIVRGNYDEVNKLLLNPAHVFSDYDPKDEYHTLYNLDDPKDAEMLQKKLGKRYRCRCGDKFLKSIYCDLSCLPVSMIRIDDPKDPTASFTCRRLGDDALRIHSLSDQNQWNRDDVDPNQYIRHFKRRTVDEQGVMVQDVGKLGQMASKLGNRIKDKLADPVYDEHVAQIMAAYTHPALVDVTK